MNIRTAGVICTCTALALCANFAIAVVDAPKSHKASTPTVVEFHARPAGPLGNLPFSEAVRVGNML